MFKEKLKSILKKRLHPIVQNLGYTDNVLSNTLFQIPNEKDKQLYFLFNNLKKIGFSPKHIIDVGANHGTWTRETLKYFPNSYYTLIEPQSWLKSSFIDILDANSKVCFIECGAGAESGSFLFTIADRDDSCTFSYTKEEAIAAGYQQVEIPVVTLNEVVRNSSNLPFPDLVKIDAEGLDLEVLEGASELMGKTEVFLVEASVFCKSLKNSLLNVVNYMDKQGYVLFEITDMNRPFNLEVLWLVELAFVKKGGIIDSYKVQIDL